MTVQKFNRGRIYLMKFLCRFCDSALIKMSSNDHINIHFFALVWRLIKGKCCKYNKMISQTQPPLSLASKQSQSHRPLVKCFIANQDALKSFFRRAVGEQADADDLFQKLLLKALKIECTDHIDNPLAYGYRMAHHLVIDHHKEQSKYPECLEHEPLSTELSLENLLDHEQRLRLYQQVLTQMPALRRDVFTRRRLHGESRQQIAQSLGFSEEAVKKHISRAMDMLKDAISEFIAD